MDDGHVLDKEVKNAVSSWIQPEFISSGGLRGVNTRLIKPINYVHSV